MRTGHYSPNPLYTRQRPCFAGRKKARLGGVFPVKVYAGVSPTFVSTIRQAFQDVKNRIELSVLKKLAQEGLRIRLAKSYEQIDQFWDTRPEQYGLHWTSRITEMAENLCPKWVYRLLQDADKSGASDTTEGCYYTGDKMIGMTEKAERCFPLAETLTHELGHAVDEMMLKFLAKPWKPWFRCEPARISLLPAFKKAFQADLPVVRAHYRSLGQSWWKTRESIRNECPSYEVFADAFASLYYPAYQATYLDPRKFFPHVREFLSAQILPVLRQSGTSISGR